MTDTKMTTGYEPKNSLSATVEAQATTIERLADALEFALAAGDPSGSIEGEWHKYAVKRWPGGRNYNDIKRAEAAARALLAEIRGVK